MQLDGRETWREAGEWWADEPYREWERYFDVSGIRRTVSRPLQSLSASISAKVEEENHSEEIALQKAHRRAARNTWGAYATRHREVSGFYESYKAKDIRRLSASTRIDELSCDAGGTSYVPLHTVSGYSFGGSLMHASDIPGLAAVRGLEAVALADPFSLMGAREFVKSAKGVGVKPLVGASFEMDSVEGIGGEIVLIARSKRGYVALSQLITACHMEEPRLYPLCNVERLRRYSIDLICLTGGDASPLNQLLAKDNLDAAHKFIRTLIDIYGSQNVFVEIERSFAPWQDRINRRLLDLSKEYALTPVAGGSTCHEHRSHFPAQDIFLCSSTLCQVEEIIGRKPRRDSLQPKVLERPERWLNAERHFKSGMEMKELFDDLPHLLENTRMVAESCDDEILPGRAKMPQLSENDSAMLDELVWNSAHRRHQHVSNDLKKRLKSELQRIHSLGYASHFLIMWDACRWATEQNILYSGRGSVVDSAVAYCLGLTRIDAFHHDLHFDRFMPADGTKRPDIDIDFEAHRRDDVRGYLSTKYGNDKVATVCAIGTFGTRGIIREVGKAMGLSDPLIGQLAKLIHGGVSPERLLQSFESRPELRDSGIPTERIRWITELAPLLADMPRNVRSHSSGVVISSEPISKIVPTMYSGVEDVPIIQWDKRSAKHSFDKFDILCLRGQDVLSGAQERIRLQSRDFDVEQISLEDEDTFRTMRSGQLIGIPQSASPAMRQAHQRLQTKDLHDASLVQAGIRPGVGGAVKLNELIARRRGKPYSYLHPDLETILDKTYGIIVFQEQVDQLLQKFGGYTCGQAEVTREAIHENRRQNYTDTIKAELYQKILNNGYSIEVADHVFDLVAGFKGYGFAQGHALAFAEISLRSIYCQQNFPAEYFAALLDAQPAGYYGPCTIANEARVRGVTILPPDVNRSTHKFNVEDVKSLVDPKVTLPNSGIRVSLQQISGISKELIARTVDKKFLSFFDYVTQANPDRDELERLILCGSFDSLHKNRRALVWSIPKAFSYAATCRAMKKGLEMEMPEPPIESVQDFLDHEKSIYERAILGMDISHHLMAYERQRITEKGIISSAEAGRLPAKTRAIVVGNPIRLRFPPTASGKRVVFFDLEDESGLLNITCFDDVYRRDGHAIVANPYVTICGEAQDRDGHTAFLAHRVYPYKPKLNPEGIAPMEDLFLTADFLAK
jgi:error-prone DNA polymerase